MRKWTLERFRPSLALTVVLASAAALPGFAAETRDDRLGALSDFATATMLAGEGNAGKAREHFERAIDADPNAAFLRLEFAEFLMSTSSTAEAGRQIEKARELAPRSQDVLRSYGQIQLALGRNDPSAISRAVEAFEQLREEAPHDLQGMVTLGQLYQGLDRHDDAVEVFEQLLRLHTDNRQLKRVLIDSLQRAGKTDRAKELLEEVLRLEQESLEGRLSLAELESGKGNHSAAIDLLENAGRAGETDEQIQTFLAVEYFRRAGAPRITSEQRQADLARAREIVDRYTNSSSSTQLRLLRAQIIASQGNAELAVDELEKLRVERPGERRVGELLAGVLESEQRFDEAAAVYRKLLVDSEDQSEAELLFLPELVRLAARAEDWQEVVDLSQRLRELDQGEMSARALGWQINALRELGRHERALAILRREEKKAGATPALLLERVELLIDLDKTEQALALLERPELSAASPIVAFRVADLLLRLERQNQAFQRIEGAVDDEAPFELLVGAGEFYLQRSLFERSVPFLVRALETENARQDEGLSADLHFYLGQAYERSGQVAPAAESFQRVLALREDDTTAMNYLGYMWAEEGENLEEALRLVERAVEMEPENGSYVDSLGWAQYKMGRYEEARVSLERAAQLTPDNATILEHLGDVYLALGDGASARDQYRRALELEDDGNLEEVRRKLRELLESPGD